MESDRFDKGQDPLFRQINSSIEFDSRLAPEDIRQSRAHVRALEKLGVLDQDELATLLAALDRVEEEILEERFDFHAADEDVHMAIERRVTEIVGPEVGGKLHTARSRNDQVATDLALYVRAAAEEAERLCTDLMRTLLETAEAHEDWLAPSYTHLQRAQPVLLAHHLLAYFWMLERDRGRFRSAAAAAGELPAGSGAAAGLNWELDREAIAGELGFERVSPNSLDAVSNRDFALDYLYAASVCAMHLSRLGSEVVIWSSQEFGFCEPDDAFASGSSIMPQKKNPDAAELLRAQGPKVSSSLTTLLGVLHALPLAYSKDLQEDKRPVFEATDTLQIGLAAATRLVSGLTFDRDALERAAVDPFMAATDAADALASAGVAFRRAHGLVAGAVREALASGSDFADALEGQLSDLDPSARAAAVEVIRNPDPIDSKKSAGGTGRAAVAEQIERAKSAL